MAVAHNDTYEALSPRFICSKQKKQMYKYIPSNSIMKVLALVLTWLSVDTSLYVVGGQSNENGNAFSAVDDVLTKGVTDHVTPGLVGIVGSRDRWLYSSAKGHKTYDISSDAITIQSGFDLASLTKVVGTTSAIARLYEQGYIELDDRLSSPELLGTSFAQNGKENVTIRHCLIHKAGFPPDPEPQYWSIRFGCPQARHLYDDLTFSCSQKIFEALLAQDLRYNPGETYVYSDLSFISLMYVVGTIVLKNGIIDETHMLPRCLESPQTHGKILQCAFEAYFRTSVQPSMSHICSNLSGFGTSSTSFCGMRSTSFLPHGEYAHSMSPTSIPRSMPNSNTGEVLVGVVEDGNAAVLGGISGHAGLFSTAPDLANYAHAWLFPEEAFGTQSFLNKTTVKLFQTVVDDTSPFASSRALGWNTNDPSAFDHGWNFSCGSLSWTTFMHIGYTGTQICIDPRREVYTILLTNRVYPVDDTASSNGIKLLRQNFNTEVQRAIDAIIVV